MNNKDVDDYVSGKVREAVSESIWFLLEKSLKKSDYLKQDEVTFDKKQIKGIIAGVLRKIADEFSLNA